MLLTLSLLALQCVAPLPVSRHRDSTNMKLAVLLVSLLFLATNPMIEAKKKPGCTKKCDTSVVQPEGDGSVGTLPCKCEKACSQKEGSKKCKKCMQKFNKKCLKMKECTKKCKNKTKKCVKQCMAGKGKDE